MEKMGPLSNHPQIYWSLNCFSGRIETGNPHGFLWVSYGFLWVSYDFLWVSEGLTHGFPSIFHGGFQTPVTKAQDHDGDLIGGKKNMAKIGNLIIKKHENLGPSSDQVFWYLYPQNHMNKMEPDHPKLIKKWFDRLESGAFLPSSMVFVSRNFSDPQDHVW
jgi:hypothetical protein